MFFGDGGQWDYTVQGIDEYLSNKISEKSRVAGI
jgi:hypothetical protein